MEWYIRNEGKIYVSFSGGKDSTVLLDLAIRKCLWRYSKRQQQKNYILLVAIELVAFSVDLALISKRSQTDFRD